MGAFVKLEFGTSQSWWVLGIAFALGMAFAVFDPLGVFKK